MAKMMKIDHVYECKYKIDCICYNKNNFKQSCITMYDFPETCPLPDYMEPTGIIEPEICKKCKNSIKCKNFEPIISEGIEKCLFFKPKQGEQK